MSHFSQKSPKNDHVIIKNMEKEAKKSGSTKSSTRVGKYVVIGAALAVFNFAVYTLLAQLLFKNNDWLWLDSAIACAATAILAYVLHSKITWKERPVSKRGVAMFFLWNGVLAFAISPFFIWVFGLIKPLYGFVFDVSAMIHLPFDYSFVESTGIFILTTIVIMILNYLFYDRLVFGGQKSSKK